MCCRNRRNPLKPNHRNSVSRRLGAGFIAMAVFAACMVATPPASAQAAKGPVRITLDEAIQLAIQHNHLLIAMRTTVQQSEAEEITQGLRPNPNFVTDWEYLPLGAPSKQNSGLYSNTSTQTYLSNNTEFDAGLSYLIER